MKSLLLAYLFSVYSSVGFPDVGFLMPDQYYWVSDDPSGSVTVFNPPEYVQSTNGFNVAFGMNPDNLPPIRTETESSDLPTPSGEAQLDSNVAAPFEANVATQPITKLDEIIAFIKPICEKVQNVIEEEKEIESKLNNLMISMQNDSP